MASLPSGPSQKRARETGDPSRSRRDQGRKTLPTARSAPPAEHTEPQEGSRIRVLGPAWSQVPRAVRDELACAMQNPELLPVPLSARGARHQPDPRRSARGATVVGPRGRARRPCPAVRTATSRETVGALLQGSRPRGAWGSGAPGRASPASSLACVRVGPDARLSLPAAADTINSDNDSSRNGNRAFHVPSLEVFSRTR